MFYIERADFFQLYDFSLDAEDIPALDGLDRANGGAVSWNPVDGHISKFVAFKR